MQAYRSIPAFQDGWSYYVAFTLGGLQQLEFALFAQHLHVEVTVGFDPVLMDLDGKSANEPQSALLIGKDADDIGTAFDRKRHAKHHYEVGP